jgi:cation:H+ antiporter
MDSLAVAVPVFLASAVVVVLGGIGLARYGDRIAEGTGWGTLWVGTILVSVATSLPELVTNISAVLIDSPELALGNVLGADMMNVFVVSMIALIFGAHRVFGNQGRNTLLLIISGMVLVGVVMAIGATGDRALGYTSIGGLVILAVYLFAMRRVHAAGKEETVVEEENLEAKKGLAKAAIGFGLCAAVILASAPFLAMSADGIAEATGLAGSFVGVLLVSLITTMPETSVGVAAAMRGSYGIVLGNAFGSNAFNVSIITVGDLFNRDALLSSMQTEHYVAGGAAIVLMAISLLVFRSANGALPAKMVRLSPSILLLHPIALFAVFRLSS